MSRFEQPKERVIYENAYLTGRDEERARILTLIDDRVKTQFKMRDAILALTAGTVEGRRGAADEHTACGMVLNELRTAITQSTEKP